MKPRIGINSEFKFQHT